MPVTARRPCIGLVACLVLAIVPAARAQASQADAVDPVEAGPIRDGSHDFDWEIGKWKTQLRRLVEPLSGSTQWADYAGTTAVSKVWNGQANLVELDVDGKAGRFRGLSLRLYNPQARQWSLNFASARSGALSRPTYGQFVDGRGEFYNQEDFNGRAILVRFVIIRLDEDSARFEQSFSDDGGKTWETNWIATDTRVE